MRLVHLETILLIPFLVTLSSNVFCQPVINSFAPVSGQVGTTVTIIGAGFSAIPTNNIVYFGAVRALVVSASTTSLSVQVPSGASYQPLTVTTGGFTSFSSKPFTVTFTGA